MVCSLLLIPHKRSILEVLLYTLDGRIDDLIEQFLDFAVVDSHHFEEVGIVIRHMLNVFCENTLPCNEIVFSKDKTNS